MKYRHKRNISLAQENSNPHSLTHRRTLSNGRTNQKHPKMHFQLNQNIVSDSLCLPMSTEFIRQCKNTSMQAKMQLRPPKKSKKLINSKERCSDSNKKRKMTKTLNGKKSQEKNEKSNPKQSKQMTKNKVYAYNGNNTQEKIKYSDKTQPKKKISVSKDQNKHILLDEVHTNWQQIIKEYQEVLSQDEIYEITQYKWIYFLGKIKNRVRQIHTSPNLIDFDSQSTKNRGHIRYINQGTFNKYQSQSQDQFYHYEIGDHMAYRYEIIESINQGSFGQVIKVFDHKSKEYLALKIVKKAQDLVKQTFIEISILTQIKEKDKANLSGIVRIKDFTIFRDHICMLFQLLDGNLYELLVLNHYNGFSQDIIRIFAVQILNSLCFLYKEKIVHCDIKPENIVMKCWGKSGVKLIDFGSSCYAGQQVFQYIQSRFYRAPEVMLKQPYSFEIDMWSFGCLLAELKLGEPIFAGLKNTQQLMYIVNSLGFPHEKDGTYSKEYLSSPQMKEILQKRYIQEYNYMIKRQMPFQTHQFFSKCKYKHKCMRTLRERIQQSNGKKSEDMNFLNFLQKLIVWEPKKRLKPHEALQDPWILNGLSTEIKQLYTMFNSMQTKKKSKSKSKSKESKGSKNKSTQAKKKSNDKIKSKQLSHERKKSNGLPQLKSKEINYQNNFYMYQNVSSSLNSR